MTSVQLPQCLRPIVLDDQCRYGSTYDGGYVIPRRVMDRCSTLLSFGINLDWRFELEMLRTFPRLHVSSFDRTTTLRRAAWWGVSRFLYSPISRRREHARALGKPFAYVGYAHHPRVTHRAQFVANRTAPGFVAVRDILRSMPDTETVLAKIDIEGAEYDILEELVAEHPRIIGMAIEFHSIEHRQAEFLRLIDRCLAHYHVSHVHVNNAGPLYPSGLPDLLEITLIRHDLVPQPQLFQGGIYRLPLDSPNMPDRPDVDIRFATQ